MSCRPFRVASATPPKRRPPPALSPPAPSSPNPPLPVPPSFPPLSRQPSVAGQSPCRALPPPLQPKLPPAFPAPQSRCRREGCPIEAFGVGRGVPAEPFFLGARFLVPARRRRLAPPKGLTLSFGRALYRAWKPDYKQVFRVLRPGYIPCKKTSAKKSCPSRKTAWRRRRFRSSAASTPASTGRRDSFA